MNKTISIQCKKPKYSLADCKITKITNCSDLGHCIGKYYIFILQISLPLIFRFWKAFFKSLGFVISPLTNSILSLLILQKGGAISKRMILLKWDFSAKCVAKYVPTYPQPPVIRTDDILKLKLMRNHQSQFYTRIALSFLVEILDEKKLNKFCIDIHSVQCSYFSIISNKN